MQLRSGRYVNRQEPDTVSRAPTRGSGTQSVSNLGRILESSEDSQSDSASIAESEKSMDPNGSQDKNQGQTNAGKSTSSNPFDAQNWGLIYNVKLQFQYANVQGADIYKDPMGRFVVKIADILSERHMNPWVNYQANMYMGEDGVRYEVTNQGYSTPRNNSLSRRDGASTLETKQEGCTNGL